MLRILLIEDDLIDQLALTRLIKKNNIDCDLTVSDSIIHAKELMTEKVFDLVVCDLNLPDGQAFELKNLIKKQPFILLSGHIDENIHEKALDFGAIQVLQKGSDLNQLSSVLDFIHQLENIDLPKKVVKETKEKNLNSNFNIQQLQHIFNNNQEEIATILELFVNQNPKMIKDAIAAIHANNLKNLKAILHRIKSNYLMLGLENQHQFVVQIESKIKTSEQDLLLQKLNALQKGMEKQYLLIEAELNKLRVN